MLSSLSSCSGLKGVIMLLNVFLLTLGAKAITLDKENPNKSKLH
uniref:Uncharacterized protein n=1 Tax=Utricularia reniformis TaxID=192314 RepID=A0A1Y0B463_9LAMI|nr:hypothetical protein AEK19_MT2045 [Utricularia reniformis]ART32202.1 hypothetical protein AEK19_MT2045 [Utricularia reniformis]